MADDDTLPPNPDDRKKRIACEFCECNLTPAGELSGKLSARARKLRDLENTVEDITAKLARSEEALAAARTEVESLKSGGGTGARADGSDYDL